MSLTKLTKSFFRHFLFSVVLPGLFLVSASHPLFAYWVWSPETGKFTNPEGAVQDTAEEQFRYALSVYEEGDRAQAIKELENLIKVYPGAKIAPDAELQLAVLLEEDQEFKKAFEHYQAILKNYPQYEQVDDIIRREYDLGHIFLNGARQKIAGIPILPALPMAVNVFKHIVETAPFSAYGDQAQFYLGEALRRSGRYEEAVKAFQEVEELYPKSELVSDAKFQAAETQLVMSSTSSRDQQGLTQAGKQFEDFLRDHPKSAEYEKAVALKKQAEEQHAKKNFDIACYYEDRGRLDSARIYFQNVADMYPSTHWGEESARRLERLKDPTAFWETESKRLIEESDRLAKTLDEITARQAALPATATAEERKTLEVEHDQIKKTLKETQKNLRNLGDRKHDDIDLRRDALKIQKNELRKKREAIKRKKKELSDVQSEDLTQAFTRWQEAVQIEEGSLRRQQERLDELARSLDVKTDRSWTHMLRLGGAPDVSKQIQRWQGELDELHAQRKLLDERRSALGDERGAILLAMETLQVRQMEMLSSKEEFKKEWAGESEALEKNKEKLEALEKEIDALEHKAITLRSGLKDKEGSPWTSVVSAPVRAVSASLDALSSIAPGKEEDIKAELAKLDLRKNRLSEKLTEQEEDIALIEETIKRASAPTEEAPAAEDPTAKQPDRRELRHRMKQIERRMREVYRQVDDHRILKNQKIDELDSYLHEAEKEAAWRRPLTRGIVRPFKGIGYVTYAFIFGLRDKEEEVSQSADEIAPAVSEETKAKLIRLQQEIEFESLVIGSKRQELLDLKRELAEAKEEASSVGGVPFQSLLLEQPYGWLKHTLTWSTKILPDSDADRILEDRLNERKAERDQLKEALAALEAKRAELSAKAASPVLESENTPPTDAMAEETGISAPSETSAPSVKSEAIPTSSGADQATTELVRIQEEIEARKSTLEGERQMYRKDVQAFYKKSVNDRLKDRFSSEEKNLFKEADELEDRLKKVNKSLSETIKDEHELIDEERKTVLEKLAEITKMTESGKGITDTGASLLKEQAGEFNHHLSQLELVKTTVSEQEKQVVAGGHKELL